MCSINLLENKMLANQETYRQRIVDHLVKRFRSQVVGINNATIHWDVVSTTTLSKDQQALGYALGLYDTNESSTQIINYDENTLNLIAEFHIKINEGDEPDRKLRHALGEVQRVVGLDIQCSEPQPDNSLFKLCQKIQVRGSEFDNFGQKPTIVAGVAIFAVTYKTRVNNPFLR